MPMARDDKDRGNLFRDAAPPAVGERFEELLRCRNVVVERIASSAAVEPTRYEQEQDEWVVLLRGGAALEVDGVVHELGVGDYLFLAAGTPHTVLRTSGDALWLAVHIR